MTLHEAWPPSGWAFCISHPTLSYYNSANRLAADALRVGCDDQLDVTNLFHEYSFLNYS